MKYAEMLNGYIPIFSQFGQDIYASDGGATSYIMFSNRINKSKSISYQKNGSDLVPVENSTIQRLLNQPNERMTQSDFFEKVFWQLFLNYNAFIIPTYVRK